MRGILVDPPGEHAEGCGGVERGCDVDREVAVGGLDVRAQMVAEQVADEPVQVSLHDGGAAPAAERPVEVPVAVCVGEDHAGRAGRMGWHAGAEGVEVALQVGAQVVEAGQQQVVGRDVTGRGRRLVLVVSPEPARGCPGLLV
ncbi:hypothetical protein ONA91_38135 [Micromonospora sp. DR5-3]|nr:MULTISPECIES: hypothetical protein [unclassified Micromonospora]MCW3820266.1 hypothetical protein [Micromonospora sp. DR5-3]